MSENFPVGLTLEGGCRIGLMPMPGRLRPLAEDVAAIAAFGARIVLSLTQTRELLPYGADRLPVLLAPHGIAWLHLPIVDFGGPDMAGEQLWSGLAPKLHDLLDAGGALVLHCHGGCGRTGMVAMRLMVERGAEPAAALARLREVRPCAVETVGQTEWGSVSSRAARQ